MQIDFATHRRCACCVPILRAAALKVLPLAVLLAFVAAPAPAEPIPVRYTQGSIHGFLALRSAEGKLLAFGDLTQTVHGDRIRARLVFHFRDGSLDDETTVFTQRHTFQLISDRHIQRGPFFPHPMDLVIDVPSGQITTRTPGKDGKDDVATDHLDLPPDLANGLVSILVCNIAPGAPETEVSMLVATPKPRVVKLAISPAGEDPVTVGGAQRKAQHFDIKIRLGGVAGVIAPIIGKQPPDIQLWIVGGEAPTFIRSEGILNVGGPSLNLELTSPVWPVPPAAQPNPSPK